MLREELEFHVRMRNCLRGIQHLDPEAVGARICEFDAQIAALQARIETEQPAPRATSPEIVPISARVRAA